MYPWYDLKSPEDNSNKNKKFCGEEEKWGWVGINEKRWPQEAWSKCRAERGVNGKR